MRRVAAAHSAHDAREQSESEVGLRNQQLSTFFLFVSYIDIVQESKVCCVSNGRYFLFVEKDRITGGPRVRAAAQSAMSTARAPTIKDTLISFCLMQYVSFSFFFCSNFFFLERASKF